MILWARKILSLVVAFFSVATAAFADETQTQEARTPNLLNILKMKRDSYTIERMDAEADILRERLEPDFQTILLTLQSWDLTSKFDQAQKFFKARRTFLFNQTRRKSIVGLYDSDFTEAQTLSAEYMQSLLLQISENFIEIHDEMKDMQSEALEELDKEVSRYRNAHRNLGDDMPEKIRKNGKFLIAATFNRILEKELEVTLQYVEDTYAALGFVDIQRHKCAQALRNMGAP